MAEMKHPGGRPTKYNKSFHPKWGKALALRGFTTVQIAEEFGVATSTVSKWLVEHKEFSESLKTAKEEPDDIVERSLFERATGYRHKVQKPMSVSQGSGMGAEIEIVEYEERVAPDVTAMIFWLKNRRPEKWREKQDIEHSGEIKVNPYHGMSADQVKAEIQRLKDQIEKS